MDFYAKLDNRLYINNRLKEEILVSENKNKKPR